MKLMHRLKGGKGSNGGGGGGSERVLDANDIEMGPVHAEAEETRRDSVRSSSQ